MPQKMKPVRTDKVQLPVHVGSEKIDLSLPTAIKLRALAPSTAATVADMLEARGTDVEWLRRPDSDVILTTPAGEDWNQDETLNSLGVRRGQPVVLTVRDASESYPALIESMADASAAINAERFRGWDNTAAKSFLAWAMPWVIGVSAVAGAGMALLRGDAVLAVAVAALFAVTAVFLSVAAIGMGRRSGGPVEASMALSAYAAGVPAAVAAVPGVSVWNVVAGASILAVMATGFLSAKSQPRWVHAAAAVPAVSVLVGLGLSAAYGLWRDVSVSATAALIALVALIIFYREIPISAWLARLSLVNLADIGENPGIPLTEELVARAREGAGNDDGWDSIFHQKERNIEARYMTMGLLISSTATVAGAVATMTATLDDSDVRWLFFSIDQRTVGFLLAASMAGVILARGTWYWDRGKRMSTIIGGASVWGAYLVSLAFLDTDLSVPRMLIALGATLLVALFVFSGIIVERGKFSIPVRHALVLAESALYALPIINVAALVNVFFHIRHL